MFELEHFNWLHVKQVTDVRDVQDELKASYTLNVCRLKEVAKYVLKVNNKDASTTQIDFPMGLAFTRNY